VYERPKALESARFVGASNILSASVVATSGSEVSVALDNGINLSIPAARFVPQTAVSTFKLADRVAITIKPEDVHLASECSGVPISAEVEGSSYHGSHTEVTMRVAGEHWRVWTTASLHLHTGQAVDLTLDVERITAFPTEAKDGT
jgi:ABC-type Fe3+/spermidine/putrescine transport system ATPase subunit